MPKHQPKVYINLRVQTYVFYEIQMYTCTPEWRETRLEKFSYLSLSTLMSVLQLDIQQTEVKYFVLK